MTHARSEARDAPDQEVESAYDPHTCEYCGEVLPDPGLSFLEHLDESETCYWLWTHYLPYIKEDAGGD